MKNNYINLILNKLIIKYEHSCLSKGGSNKNIKISLTFDEKNMPDYVSEDSYQYEKFIETAVKEIQEKKFVEVSYKNKRINRVYLIISNVLNIYDYLKKEPKTNIDNEYLNILQKYENNNDLTKSFCDLIKKRIVTFRPIKIYFEDKEELEDILIILTNLPLQEVEISKRIFSAKYLHDSKKLERIESKIIHIISKLLNDDDISLEKYNIYQNPTFVYLRGKITLKIGKQIIDTTEMNNEIILTTNQLENLNVISFPSLKVITVENLTSFYNFSDGDYVLIYLGGFHNIIKRNLLKKIYEYNHRISFYHAGDVDIGGFYILNHLITKTEIAFEPLKMDKDTLMKYRNYCNNLTSNDRKRLCDMLNSSLFQKYYDTLSYMLKENIKLEQENIDY